MLADHVRPQGSGLTPSGDRKFLFVAVLSKQFTGNFSLAFRAECQGGSINVRQPFDAHRVVGIECDHSGWCQML